MTRQYEDTDSDSKEEIEVLMQGNGDAMGPWDRTVREIHQKWGALLAANISIYNEIQMCRMIYRHI